MKHFTNIIKKKYGQDTKFMEQMTDWAILNSISHLSYELNDVGIKFKIQKTLDEIEEVNEQ